MRFVRDLELPVPASELFAFHERPDAFALLQPPWQKTRIIQPPTSLEVGTVVIVEVKVGPLWRRIVARHVAYEPGARFADEMVEGPFASWHHEHLVVPLGPARSRLRDQVDYTLPLGFAGRIVAGRFVERTLERLFAYRHEVTARETRGRETATR